MASGEKFIDGKYIHAIYHEIDKMIKGENNRLILNLAPRHLKSLICSVALPAWLLGKYPEKKIMCISYGEDLAKEHASNCIRIMESDWYKRAFGNVLEMSNPSVLNFKTIKNGMRYSATVEGKITGFGGDWIIIDDPLKPGDAMSDVQRKKVNEIYQNTISSRLNNVAEGKILLTMQRVHENDLSGFLKNKAGSTFRAISMPLIAEHEEEWTLKYYDDERLWKRKKGAPLHPERYDLDVIEMIRNDAGERTFCTQYQQNPYPADGGIILKEWLENVYLKEPEFREIVMSWDTAAGDKDTNANSACCVFGVDDEQTYYLLEVFKAKLLFPDLLKTVLDKHDKYKRYGLNPTVVIENASSGRSLADTLERDYSKINVERINAVKDKVVRMGEASLVLEKGRCKFSNTPKNWWSEFEQELLAFPVTSYKDQCDAFAQGLIYLEEHSGRPNTLIAELLDMKKAERKVRYYNPMKNPLRNPNAGPKLRNTAGLAEGDAGTVSVFNRQFYY